MLNKKSIGYTPIPTLWMDELNLVGLNVAHPKSIEKISIPLATYESPMWASVNRGIHVFNASGGLTVNVVSEQMTRSVVFSTESISQSQEIWQRILYRKEKLQGEIDKVSSYTKLIDLFPQFVGNQLFVRLSFKTGDASGHNMATLAAQCIQNYWLKNFKSLEYGSISANICVDKKNSAINGILGRGKSVIAECVIPQKYLLRYLKTDVSAMMQLNTQKNYLGSILAGSVRSANAHYANMLLAFYLACGQDGANVVEGSQGITYLEARGQDNEDLYFSVSIPNIIVGSIGNGKHLPEAKKALHKLNCLEEKSVGENARRLACIAAASVAAGELSLLAAQTNQGELVEAHLRLERRMRESYR